MDALAIIEHVRQRHLEAVDRCLSEQAETIAAVADKMADCLQSGGKILSCGNGGSACDAMHFAGECVGRFVTDRKALPAIALSADPGILTAVGNDYGFENIFSRQVEAHGAKGDILVAISTSGQSPNVLKAIQTAKTLGLYTVLLTGERGINNEDADVVIAVPSPITAHIQETHITVLQLMIAIIEDKIL